MANQEGKVLLALDDIKNGRIKSIRAAAKLYDIPYSTLHARANHRVSREDTRANSHKLTGLEEDSLIQWIFSMDSRGAAPRRSTVREMADILLAARGITPPPTVGVNGYQISLNDVMRFEHAFLDDITTSALLMRILRL